MNKLIYIFFIIPIAFLSCDGRDRVHRTNKEVLIEHKLLDSFSENIKYYPEAYSEIRNDTILSNGYRVNIKLYSDMNNAVLVERQEGKIISKTHHRKLLTDVEIYKDNIRVYSNTINANFLLNKGVLDAEESNNYLAQGFWLETYDDVHDGAPILFLDYVNIQSKKRKLLKFVFIENTFLIEEIT